MRILSLVLGLLIAGLGLLSILSPESFSEILREIRTPTGMYFAAGGRVIFRFALLVSAKKSRAPDVLRVLGWVFLVPGLFIPVIGFENFRSIVDAFLSMGHWAARVWGVVALAFGLFVACSVAPRANSS